MVFLLIAGNFKYGVGMIPNDVEFIKFLCKLVNWFTSWQGGNVHTHVNTHTSTEHNDVIRLIFFSC